MIPVFHLNRIARFLIVLCIIPLIFGFGACYAVGFGPSNLHSYLNEPLDLDIELVDVESISIDNLTASLANVDDFKRAEMQRPYFLSRLRFEVKRMGRRSFIKVTSPDAIKQPFLDFLVDLSWPGGHSVKGYTILLDPAPATDARRNAIPPTAGKIADKHNMESLFGPEDKTHIPASPIEAVIKDGQSIQSGQAGQPGQSRQAEIKQDDTKASPEPMASNMAVRTEAVSYAGKLVNSFSNMHKDQQNKITEQSTEGAPVSNVDVLKETTPKAPTAMTETHPNQMANKTQNVAPSHPSDKSLSSNKPLSAHTKAGEKGLPLWLFWTSIFAMLCIISLTIWALNKYRLAKPKSRSDSEYFEAIGAGEKNHSKFKLDRRRSKAGSVTSAEPDPGLREELKLKLVLAAQYIDVNDQVAAKKLLDEVLEKGNDQQKAEAKNLSLKMNVND